VASSRILQVLKDISSLPSAGPPAAFSYLHVCRAVLLVGDEGPIGRLELSRKLGLGEGTTRTIIKHLTRAGVGERLKGGCVLTRRGKTIYKQLRNRLSNVMQFDAKVLALGKANAAIMIRASGMHVKRGIEQRDAALLAGAKGALTILFERSGYVMPDERKEKLDQRDPLVLKLNSYFQPRDKDVLIIVGAEEERLAHYGALAAALTLFD